jgi:peptidoglycan/xylan/chitin deacetylase (PgdA/CDA1 family)
MKRFIQSALCRYHCWFSSRPLPERLALYYHSLDPEEHGAFAESIQWLKSLGYRFVGPGDFLTAAGKVCYISFDDNFKAWHDAAPLFDDLGVRAAFFVNTCVLRGECTIEDAARYCRVIDYRRPFIPLSRDEIRGLHKAGHWVGAHTHSHVALSRVSPDVAEEELRRNRDLLEDITGSVVTDVAFPFGLPRYFSDSAREVCVRLGFKTISWATPGMLHHQGNPLAIHRTQWYFARSAAANRRNLEVDGRWFVSLTGRSPVG